MAPVTAGCDNGDGGAVGEQPDGFAMEETPNVVGGFGVLPAPFGAGGVGPEVFEKTFSLRPYQGLEGDEEIGVDAHKFWM